MSWNFRIKQPDKIALALGAVFLVIVLANWFVSYSMNRIGGQFKSVYEDRLVPALDISMMLEHYYQNRLLLEEHVLATQPRQQDSLQQLMQANNQALDSLLVKYETTYLTTQESQALAKYKTAFRNLSGVQQEILHHSRNSGKATATELFATEGKNAFLDLLEPLHTLSRLQQEVGHELYASAERQVQALKVLSYLVMGMAVLIALLIATLLQTSRKLRNIKKQQYHMN